MCFLFFFSQFAITEYFQYTTGCRGSCKLRVGDYTFTKNKTIGNRVYWSCARAGLHKCKARVLTIVEPELQKAIVKCEYHNHEPF